MSNVLALFDFDGTLTTKDSLSDFILFAFGKPKTVIGGILLAPTLAGYAVGLIDNSIAKQRVLKYFFGGISTDRMREFGEAYAKQRLPKILRPAGTEKLKWHQDQGHKVVIVSASTEYWLKSWTDEMGFDLLATQLDVQNNELTGYYLGQNCHGEEKIRRIKASYDLSKFDEIYAYGDTSGDKPMLALANHGFYKPFRQ